MTPSQQLQDAQNNLMKAAELSGEQSFFSNALENAIQERSGYNEDLIREQARLVAQRESLPATLREEFQSSAIRDPFAQESLISQRRANIGEQLGGVTDLLAQRGQRFSDILNNATTGFNERIGTLRDTGGLQAQFAENALSRQAAGAAAAQQNSLQEAALALQERMMNQQYGVGDTTGTYNAPIDPSSYQSGMSDFSSLVPNFPNLMEKGMEGLLASTPLTAPLLLADPEIRSGISRNVSGGIGALRSRFGI